MPCAAPYPRRVLTPDLLAGPVVEVAPLFDGARFFWAVPGYVPVDLVAGFALWVDSLPSGRFGTGSFESFSESMRVDSVRVQLRPTPGGAGRAPGVASANKTASSRRS